MASLSDLMQSPYPVILGTEAMSRFTKAPIIFRNVGKEQLERPASINYLMTKLFGPPDFTQPSTGGYNFGTGDINVSSYQKVPTWQDVMGTVHHEDIHSLLGKAGYTYPELTSYPTRGYNPITKAANAFNIGSRGGDVQRELPAYVGAYNPNQLPGFTEEDRQAYLDRLYPTLKPDVAQTLMRIIQSYNASQNPPFATLQDLMR